MKMMELAQLACILVPALCAAFPHPSAKSTAIPNYPGVQFGPDGKLSISVFSDLHFGERMYPLQITTDQPALAYHM